MEAVGWIMHNDDGCVPVVIAATDRGTFLIRDSAFAHGRSWFAWESKDVERDGRWVTETYEDNGYRLAVEPLQRSVLDSFLGNPVDQYEEDEVESTMAPLLDALVAKLGLKLPKLSSAYNLSFYPGSPHIYADGNYRPAPAVAIVEELRRR